MKKTHLFYLIAVFLGIIQGVYFYPLLPENMAVHFGADGQADGWGSKDGFYQGMGIVFAIMTVLFGAMPWILRAAPDSIINLPNKDYWLTPERRENTIERLAEQMLLFGSIALLFLDGTLYLCFQANYSAKAAMNAKLLWGMIGGFAAITIVWILSLIRSLRRPAI